MVGTTKNITERKREQRALQEAVEADTSANRAKAEFLATMSHEISKFEAGPASNRPE